MTQVPYQQPQISAINYYNLPIINYIMDRYGQSINLQTPLNSDFKYVQKQRLLKNDILYQRLLHQMQIQEQVNPSNYGQPLADINISGLGGIFGCKNQFGSRLQAPTNIGRFNDETINCKMVKLQTEQEINQDYMRASDVQIYESKQCQQQILNSTKVSNQSQNQEFIQSSPQMNLRGNQNQQRYQVSLTRVLQEDGFLQKKMTNEIKTDEQLYSQIQINDLQDLKQKRQDIQERYIKEQNQIIQVMRQNKRKILQEKIHSNYYRDLQYTRESRNKQMNYQRQQQLFNKLRPLMELAVKNYGTLNTLQDAQLLPHCRKIDSFQLRMSFDDLSRLYKKQIEESKLNDQI